MAADAIQGFGSLVFAQIRYLVVNLNKKNQKSSTSEIAHLLGMYGEGAFVYLLQCLVEEIDFRDAKLQKDQLKVQLLEKEFGKLASRPNFTQLVCQIFGAATLASPLTEDFLITVVKAIKAPMIQQVALGLGLARSSEELLASEGAKFLRTKLSELTSPPGREALLLLSEDLVHALLFFVSTGDRQESFARPRAALVKVLQQVYPEERVPLALLPLLYGSDQASELNSRLTFEKERARLVDASERTAPLPTQGAELAELIQDLGYSCCANAKCLGEVLAQYASLPAACVASVLGMMACTASSLDDSLSLHGAFATAVSGKYLEFDAKFDADKEDTVKALTAWNLDAFVEAVNAKAPELSWREVFEQLDQPTLDAPGAEALRLLLDVHKKAVGGKLPGAVLLGNWKNGKAQLELLSHALDAAVASELDWSAGDRVGADAASLAAELGCWQSLDLVRALLWLSRRVSFPRVQALFAAPLQHAPQLVLAACLQVAEVGSPHETQLQQELLEQTFPLFLGGDSAGSAALLQKLWALQPQAVMRAMAQLHAAQPASLLRLLDLAQSFSALKECLKLPYFAFALDLATVAQRKDLIQLEPWLQEALAKDAADDHAFVNACFGYLREKLLGGSPAGARALGGRDAGAVSALSVESAAIFFKCLHQGSLPAPLADELSKLYAQCVQVKPKLQQHYNAMQPPAEEPAAPAAAPAVPASPAGVAASPGAGAAATPTGSMSPMVTPSSPMAAAVGATTSPPAMPGGEVGAGMAGGVMLPGMPGGQEVQFGQEIEEEANSYFQKLYTGVVSIDELIGMLKGFQHSAVQREQQVYACMVHNLFDEYRYFPKYPDKPLLTTALLFGALVQHGLVSNITLGMFLRYVLEALRKPIGSKMCKFGATALEQFKARLSEWPQYCQHLHAIPHIGQVQPEILPYLEAVLAGKPPPATPANPTEPAAAASVPGLDLRVPPGVAQPTGGAPPGALGGLGGAAPAAAPAGQLGGLGGGLNLGGGAPGLGVPSVTPQPSLDTPGVASSVLPAGLLGGGGAAANPAVPRAPAMAAAAPPAAPASVAVPNLTVPGFEGGAATASMTTPGGSAAGGVAGFGPGVLEAALVTIEQPPEALQDKVGFVLNNLSPGNVPQKGLELRAMLAEHESMVQWFANYLVVKRVSLEPNFHQIYSEMLDVLSHKVLAKSILLSTMQNAQTLLSSPKIRSSSSERSLLKNLGSWLGQVTLARNKPILMRDLDMKELICDAYETGRLIAVVPFVAKVLDACPNSQVFMPPNPWVMGLLALLLELYNVPDLKLNLKFEIEVLAKTLKVELADMKPANKLAQRTQDKSQTCDFANRAGMVAAGLGSGASGFGNGFGGAGLAGGAGGSFCGSSFQSFVPQGAGAQGMGGGVMGSMGGGMMPDGSPALPGGTMGGSFGGGFGQPQPPPPPPPGQPGQAAGNAAMLALAQQQQQQQQLQQQQQQVQQQQAAQQAAAQQAAAAAAQQQPQSLLGSAALPGQASVDPALAAGLQEQTVIPNLASYVVINSGLQLFTQQPQLKRIVPIAIDRAIREIISPVVERSVTISCVTTRELMLKDFAMEPDEQRMRKAAQLMVQNLAGSLALVTCKEPLRVACGNHMRSLLQQACVDAQLLEQVTQVCSNDNLELGCTLIEKAATEKAVRDIEEALAPAFAIRRKHREQTGLPYYDMSIFTSGRYPASLPEALRPRPGGLQPAQRRVYEDFGRIPRTAAMVQQQQAQQAAAAQAAQQAAAGGAPGAMPPLPQQGGASFGGAPGTSSLLGGASMLPGGAGAPGATDPLGQLSSTPAAGRLPGMGGDSGALGQLSVPGLGGQIGSFGTASSVASSVLGAGGAAPPADVAASGAANTLSKAQAGEKLSICVAKLDMIVQQLAASGVASIGSLPAEHDLHALLRQVSSIIACSMAREETALAMVQKIFKRMYEPRASQRLATQVDVQLIARIHSVCNKVARFVSDMVLYSDEERKLNREVVFALLGAQMLHMGEFGSHLAKEMNGGRNAAVVAFSMSLIDQCLLKERTVVASDCKELLTSLAQLAQAGQAPEGLIPLLEQVHATALAAAAAAGGGAGAAAAAKPSRPVVEEEVDPAVARMREQVTPLWEEWLAICEQPNQSDKAYAAFLQSLATAGYLLHNETGERFLRVLCEFALSASTTVASEAVAALAASQGEGGKPINFVPLDALSKLVLLMVKFVPAEGGDAAADGAKPKAQVQLLTRVLAALMHLLLRSYQGGDFQQRAFFRLFSSWLFDLNAPDPTLDPIQPQVLSAFCSAFHALQPARLPGFAFSWMELVSHRMFMPKLLLTKGQKGWPLMQRLLVGLFKFLHPYLSQNELSPPVRMLYRGALRVLLVLLHDFPEFLCDYHFAFCDVIPPSCIQMRNLILSAFPRNMRLPDPFTPNLKVDLLPEISQPPRILSSYSAALSAGGSSLLSELDAFLKSRQPVAFPFELKSKVAAADGSYRVPLINALVLHVGTSGISQGAAGLAHSAPMDIFQQLASELAPEGRYLFLNAIANQLRYPNNHTHYFSCVLLYLFSEASDERVQEQITRVLVERLIVHRPHPWGLLITFIELIKNPRYNFWCASAPLSRALLSPVRVAPSRPPCRPLARSTRARCLVTQVQGLHALRSRDRAPVRIGRALVHGHEHAAHCRRRRRRRPVRRLTGADSDLIPHTTPHHTCVMRRGGSTEPVVTSRPGPAAPLGLPWNCVHTARNMLRQLRSALRFAPTRSKRAGGSKDAWITAPESPLRLRTTCLRRKTRVVLVVVESLSLACECSGLL